MKVQTTLLIGLFLAWWSVIITVGGWAQAESQRTQKGAKVYAEKQCALCHVVQGKGGKAGPDLSDVGAKRDAQWLGRFMMAPSAVVPKAKMPPFQGSADELDALVAYLRSLDRR